MQEQKVMSTEIENERNIKEELVEQKKISEERLNQLKYLQADFDNMRKHFEKEKKSIMKLANESLIKELIVVLDDFENSFKIIGDEKSNEGIKRIYGKFYGILSKHGLKEIESKGQINPDYHDVLYKEQSDKDDGEILEEIQKGYSLNSHVIRAAKVKVSEKFKKESSEKNMGEQNG